MTSRTVNNFHCESPDDGGTSRRASEGKEKRTCETISSDAWKGEIDREERDESPDLKPEHNKASRATADGVD